MTSDSDRVIKKTKKKLSTESDRLGAQISELRRLSYIILYLNSQTTATFQKIIGRCAISNLFKFDFKFTTNSTVPFELIESHTSTSLFS